MIYFYILTASCMLQDFDPSLESHLSINGVLTVGFFYDKHQQNFDEYKKMLSRVIQYTEDFEIILVNCSNYLSTCIDQFAEQLPSVKLYLPKGSKPVTMALEMSLYNIITFITQRTKIKSRLPQSKVLNINRNNYASFFYTGDYHIIEYIENNDQSSEMLNISFEELSNIYSNDIDIKFGRVDCTGDIDFCLEVGASSVPIINLYKNGEVTQFYGTREIPYILNFINENCNKHRSINGENKFVMEFDSKIEEIVDNFMKNPNKSKFIDEIKTFKNGQAYSVIMNRIMKEGEPSIGKMLTNLRSLSKDQNVKDESFYNVAEKISMLKLFHKHLPYVEETEL